MAHYHPRHRTSSRKSPRRAARRKTSPTWRQRLGKALLITLAVLIFTPLTLSVIYRFVPVPLTPLMLIRMAEGYHLTKNWKGLEDISPHLRRSVVAAEDNLFCVHNGFDWKSLNKAIGQWSEGNSSKGGSTISMQVAKNVFLVPNRAVWRKALELPLTALIEALWPKQRLLEIYLNVAEWGPGVYGAEAAARYHFKTSAKRLTQAQAAQLAAILPLPLTWSAKNPGPYVAARARQIQRRTYQLGPLYLGCTQPLK